MFADMHVCTYVQVCMRAYVRVRAYMCTFCVSTFVYDFVFVYFLLPCLYVDIDA